MLRACGTIEFLVVGRILQLAALERQSPKKRSSLLGLYVKARTIAA